MHVVISLYDPLNPSLGYKITIDRNGETLLLASEDPETGADLTYGDCLRIAGMYHPRGASPNRS